MQTKTCIKYNIIHIHTCLNQTTLSLVASYCLFLAVPFSYSVKEKGAVTSDLFLNSCPLAFSVPKRLQLPSPCSSVALVNCLFGPL